MSLIVSTVKALYILLPTRIIWARILNAGFLIGGRGRTGLDQALVSTLAI